MKKLFFLLSLVFSISAFASKDQVPLEVDLANYYDPSKDGDNHLTNEEANTVYDLRVDTEHQARYDDSPLEYVVLAVNLPVANCPETIEVTGDFDGWVGTTMELLDSDWWFVELEAKENMYFKFRGAGSWDQELELYDAENDEWKKIADGQLTFGQLWDEGYWKGALCKWIELDFSDPNMYRWTGSNTRRGECGDNLQWAYVDSVLTIFGIGDMWDMLWDGQPWELFKQEIKQVVFSPGITSIGDHAFYECTGLTSIEIPNSVTSIGDWAFSYCTGLTSIEIPNSVTSIGAHAFTSCRSLPSIEIPNSVTSIGDYTFSGCYGLTSVTIPNSVTSIGEGAFVGCTGLTSIEIPNSVTSIGMGAFLNCTGFISIEIPNSVISIGENAFYGCTGLTFVKSEAISPPILGNEAFMNTNNCSIYVPCNTLDAYKTAWSAYSSQIKNGPLEYSIIGNVNIEGAGSVLNPQNMCENKISAISNYGYHFTQWSDGNTENPRTIILTQDTTFTAEFAIDKSGACGKNNALMWSYDDQSETLTIIGDGALTDNYTYGVEAPTQMNTLIIGDGVTAIGDSAFYGISTINHLVIGGNVASIGDYAFAECKNFDDITCYATVVPTINGTTFVNVGNKQYIYLFVPEDRERAYKRDTWWGQFDIQIKSAEETTTDGNVTVVPTDNTVEITWPSVNNAETYEIVITKEGEVVCTLIFNANGQLTGIAFAPSRNNTQQAQTAGFRFTVTGLTSNTHYDYTITSKDAEETTLDTKSGSFTTSYDGQSIEGIEDVLSTEKVTKLLHNSQILILRGDKTYTITGQEVK